MPPRCVGVWDLEYANYKCPRIDRKSREGIPVVGLIISQDSFSILRTAASREFDRSKGFYLRFDLTQPYITISIETANFAVVGHTFKFNCSIESERITL